MIATFEQCHLQGQEEIPFSYFDPSSRSHDLKCFSWFDSVFGPNSLPKDVHSAESVRYEINPEPLAEPGYKPWIIVRATPHNCHNSSVILKIAPFSTRVQKIFSDELQRASDNGFRKCERLVTPIDWQLEPTEGFIFLVFPDRNLDAHDFITYRKDGPIFRILLDVCEGVIFLHNLKLCHRDIKLENICIFEDRAYLIDLELVDSTGLKYQGIVGTEVYLPLELRNGSAEHVIQEENDVFAVGIVGLQLFAKRTLNWEQEGEDRPLDLLAAVPEDLQDWFEKALNENPEHRPTLMDLADRLRGRE
jgi:serine/threonine protein kinase